MASCHTHAACYGIFYSPTEYAEFTEPPTEMSSHGFHRFTQILRVRYSPTEFTEFTEFGSVGMAGMPYPPTSVRIRVICGRLFSARSFCEFRAFCGNLFPPTDFTDLHRYLGCAVLPRNSRNSQNLSAWVWQGCHTLLHLCSSVSSVGGSSLQEVLCIRCIPWELLHRLFGWCSSCSGKRQSRAETAAPPGLAAWVWQGCHTLLHLCSFVSSVGGSSLQEVLCIRCIPWELLHRLFGWCSRDCCTPWRNPRK